MIVRPGRLDPGPCPICGASHAACTTSSGAIVVPQLPARDALEDASRAPEASSTPVSTKDYRGDPGKKRR